MKTLEKAQDKIQKICSILREETLAPAQKDAQEIIEKAQQKAEQIINAAEKAAKRVHEEAKASVEKEYAVFQATLQQAVQQGVEALRQVVENKFFNDNLVSIIEKSAVDTKIVASLINAIVKAIEKDGLDTDLTVLVPKTIEPRQLNELLMQDVLKFLKEKSVVVGNFSAGVQVRLNNKKMSIDVTEEALRELLATYVARKDFRKLIFTGA